MKIVKKPLRMLPGGKPFTTKPNHPWRLMKIGTGCGNSEKRKKALAEVKKRAKMFAN
jgi:hypothetical protein